MGIFSAIFEERAESIDLTHPKDPALARLFGLGTETAAGVAVNEKTALNYSAYFAAIRIISETVASLPLLTYERLGEDERRRAMDSPVWDLLHDAPNDRMRSMVFRETLTQHILGWGNGFAEIRWDRDGNPTALEIHTPDTVQVQDVDAGLRYVITVDGDRRLVDANNMIHIPGLGFDGRTGYSVAAMARESIGLGLATEQFGATYFGNNAVPGGVLEHPGRLGDDALRHIKESWQSSLTGANAHKLKVLEEGMAYKQIGIPPDDSQFLESRSFQVIEMARWFNLPPHILKDLTRATFSNIEQQNLEFLTFSIRPWLIRWQQELNYKLWPQPAARQRYFVEHLPDALLSVDTSSRFSAYKSGREAGIFSVNEIRKKENLNPIGPQGDIYLVPANMMDASQVGSEEPADEPPEPVEEPTTIEVESDALRAKLVCELERVISGEIRDARRSAKSPDKFNNWLDRYYSKHRQRLEDTLTGVLQLTGSDHLVGRSEQLASDYCERSYNALLEITGAALPTTLGGYVDEEVGSWESRAKQLADEAMP